MSGWRGRESEGARCVMPAARTWLRCASDPLCISCVRSSLWALMRTQQTMHHTFHHHSAIDDDRQNITDFDWCRCRKVPVRHDKTRCRPSLRPMTVPTPDRPSHAHPAPQHTAGRGEVIDTKADVTPSQMEVDIRMKRCSNEHAPSDRRGGPQTVLRSNALAVYDDTNPAPLLTKHNL